MAEQPRFGTGSVDLDENSRVTVQGPDVRTSDERPKLSLLWDLVFGRHDDHCAHCVQAAAPCPTCHLRVLSGEQGPEGAAIMLADGVKHTRACRCIHTHREGLCREQHLREPRIHGAWARQYKVSIENNVRSLLRTTSVTNYPPLDNIDQDDKATLSKPRQNSISTISLTMGRRPAWWTPSPRPHSSRTRQTCAPDLDCQMWGLPRPLTRHTCAPDLDRQMRGLPRPLTRHTCAPDLWR
eukprot:5434675-Pyramimonas_sp.AAC.2